MNLSCFKIEQNLDFDTALSEIQCGRKRSHWMWYIFPQLKGLGKSEMSDYYGIDGMEEAKAYLADSTLRKNLVSITKALLAIALSHADEFTDILQDLAMQTACIGQYSATQAGGGGMTTRTTTTRRR